MYNNSEREFRRVIEGPSLDFCKDKLFKMYKSSYHIVDYEQSYKEGLLGFGGKEFIRVYYTLDTDIPKDSTKSFNERVQNTRSGATSYAGFEQGTKQSAYGSGTEKTSANFGFSKEDLLKKLTNSVDTVKKLAEMQSQLNSMESILSQLKDFSGGRDVHASIRKIDNLLEKNEFTKSYIEKMNSKISSDMSVDELEDFDLLQKNVLEWIGESIKIAPKYANKNSRLCHTIIIVGPTGVGKTTTIAKMAATIIRTAKKSKQDLPRFLFLTTDKERMAAAEQLQHYAELMESEFQIASNMDDFEDLYASYKNKKDFIFVDTCGYSPHDIENIGKLHRLLNVDGLKADVYLAVSASTKASDMEVILRNFDPFEYRSVIITKCDETSSYGNVLSVLSEKKKPISLVTFGQKTLNNMQRANPYYFLKGLKDFTVDTNLLMEEFGSEDEYTVE